ncbi:MAG: extracellular solute-binding protein, partial [bacterium]
VAAALLYNGFNVNSEDAEELALAEAALTNAGFISWGEDSLKSYVITGTLDMALVYSGDYFSEYYIALEEEREITFDYFVPTTTNVWMDGICIPTIAENVALAHEFIDFFLRYDIALANSDYIGYAPPYAEVYQTMVNNPDYGYSFPTFDPFPEGSNRQMYTYGSDARSEALVAILSRARGNG